jgi:hypothetical protein
MRLLRLNGVVRTERQTFVCRFFLGRHRQENKSTRVLGNSVRLDRQESIFVGGITHLLFQASELTVDLKNSRDFAQRHFLVDLYDPKTGPRSKFLDSNRLLKLEPLLETLNQNR